MYAIGSKKNLLSNEICDGYYETVRDLLENELVQKMKGFTQHGNTSTFQHCVNVSYYNFKICKFFNLDARAGARAGLLHDFFLYDWHTHTKETGDHFHGMTHPKAALKNACQHFELTECEKDIILKHMFPLTITPPSYKETIVIVLVDKYCGLIETASYICSRIFRRRRVIKIRNYEE
ncbi:MAG: HD family phosphohydrolase [Oscillospiraceae bacterium]|nr:HD family phosphohydrolase [Oscillospiraceae bacterium]